MATLLFVYNAGSGLFNTLSDIAHKIFSPGTYPCQLCALTHTPLGMRKEWKAFLTGLNVPFEFLHRDEFHNQYGRADVPLPAIFRRDGTSVETWIDAATLRAIPSLDELQRLIRDRLAASAQAS
jgi:hypothetical protein